MLGMPMTTYSRIITIKERQTVRNRCEGCGCFRIGLFGSLLSFGNAFCSYEGRIIERSYWTSGCVAFNRTKLETGFLLPRWCPLPAVSKGDCP